MKKKAASKSFAKVPENRLLEFSRRLRIEDALGCIQEKTLRMRSGDDLGGVTTLLFYELRRLASKLWTCGFPWCDPTDPDTEQRLGLPREEMLATFKVLWRVRKPGYRVSSWDA